MIMNCIKKQVERKCIAKQAGFRPGKSCTGQVLNLYKYIEDGYENKKITGVVLVVLSAAYDTVNHNLLLKKIYKCKMTGTSYKKYLLCYAIDALQSRLTINGTDGETSEMVYRRVAFWHPCYLIYKPMTNPSQKKQGTFYTQTTWP